MHSNQLPKIFAAAVFLVAAMFVSCQGLETDTLALEIKTTGISATSGSQFVGISAEGDWTVSVYTDDEYRDSQEVDWAWFNEWDSEENVVSLNGSGTVSNLLLYWSKNLSDTQRTATVELVSGTKVVSVKITQEKPTLVSGSTPDKMVSDAVCAWMELPAMGKDDGMYFITHDMTISGSTVRNYSYYYDEDAYVAQWVAYPLNKGLIGSGTRTNAWGTLDPKVPRDSQPILSRGFSSATSERYDRGHQLPSADRYTANTSTFYGTNMTPQKSQFNQQIWARFEGMVREWSYVFDTLYVVTGCNLKNVTEYAYDNEGKTVAVPSGYYKALLGYKKNGTVANTATTGGYSGCAFYFDHVTTYTNNTATIMERRMTIDELEELLGMDFFVNLPSAIGTTNAAAVEASVDSFWDK